MNYDDGTGMAMAGWIPIALAAGDESLASSPSPPSTPSPTEASRSPQFIYETRGEHQHMFRDMPVNPALSTSPAPSSPARQTAAPALTTEPTRQQEPPIPSPQNLQSVYPSPPTYKLTCRLLEQLSSWLVDALFHDELALTTHQRRVLLGYWVWAGLDASDTPACLLSEVGSTQVGAIVPRWKRLVTTHKSNGRDMKRKDKYEEDEIGELPDIAKGLVAAWLLDMLQTDAVALTRRQQAQIRRFWREDEELQMMDMPQGLVPL